MKLVVVFLATFLVASPAFAQDTGWIGISITEQPDRGVLVRSVEANSPAERAGLRASDVIVQFNKQDVVGVLQLQRLVNETPVGRSVDVTVRRDNRDQTLKVTSEKSPSPFSAFHVQQPDFTVFRDHLNDNFNQNVRIFSRNNNEVAPFLAITSASVSQAGIRAESMTAQLRDFFGVKAGEGVLISSVDANSAGSKAGLMAGDVVTAIDGRIITSPQDFNRELRSRQAAFTLKVVRNKQDREIRVEQ